MPALKGLEPVAISRAKTNRIGTPSFPVQWAKMGTPQTGGEYDGPYGQYRFDLVIDPDTEEGAKFIKKFEASHESLMKVVRDWTVANKKTDKVTNFRVSPLKDQTRKVSDPSEAEELGVDVGDKVETGKKVLKFSQDAAKKSKKTGLVTDTPLFVTDASGTEIPIDILNRVGNGTEVRVAFNHRPYIINDATGTTCSIVKVIITTLKEFGKDVVDSDYFDDELEGSFSVDDTLSGASEDVEDEVDTTDDF